MKRIFVLLAAAAMWVGCDQTRDQGGMGPGSETQRGTSGIDTNQTNSISQQQPQQPQQQPQPQQPTPEQ